METKMNRIEEGVRLGLATEEVATPCLLALSPAIRDFQEALAQVESSPGNELFENRLCLTSRTAYFHFFEWAVLHDEIDDNVAQTLSSFFERSLQTMQVTMYRDSVASRFEDLKAVCERVRDHREAASLTSI
jgi:hypothetical protein